MPTAYPIPTGYAAHYAASKINFRQKLSSAPHQLMPFSCFLYYDKAEDDCGRDAEAERAGVGQEAHHDHSHESSDQKVGEAATEASPCVVAASAHYWLHYHAHERRQYPEIAEIMRVGSDCGEDAAHLSALQSVGDLHAEKSEAEVPQFPEPEITLVFHTP